MNILAELAAFVATASARDLPTLDRGILRRHAADAVVARLAGAQTSEGRAVAALFPPHKGADSIAGLAALVRLTEIDDIHLPRARLRAPLPSPWPLPVQRSPTAAPPYSKAPSGSVPRSSCEWAKPLTAHACYTRGCGRHARARRWARPLPQPASGGSIEIKRSMRSRLPRWRPPGALAASRASLLVDGSSLPWRSPMGSKRRRQLALGCWAIPIFSKAAGSKARWASRSIPAPCCAISAGAASIPSFR